MTAIQNIQKTAAGWATVENPKPERQARMHLPKVAA